MAARPGSTTPTRNVSSEIAYLARALKTPSLAGAVARLAERARAESWTHEEFLATCLQREVAARESHGGEDRIHAARFPALDFVTAKNNVVFLGPPGTGKTHLPAGPGIRACQAGHRVAFATAAQRVARLTDACHAGRLQDELTRLGRVPLLVIDEVGYIPSRPRPPTCSSSPSPAATNGPASSSPATSPSAGGARSSATPSPPP
jgi:DNA replication protein DnaC